MSTPNTVERTAPVDQPGGEASVAVERTLRWAVLIWSGLWLVIISLSLTASQEGTGLLSWVLLASVALTWVVTVLAGRRRITPLIVVLAVTAWAQAAVSNPLDVMAQTRPVVAWTILAAVAAGLTWSGRAGVSGVLAIAAGEAAILLAVATTGGVLGQSWAQVMAVSAFALADGMAAVTAAAALRRAAAASDTSAAALAQAKADDAAAEARALSARRAARILHDTVVNTLGVIRRGTDSQSLSALRQRCAADVAGIADIWLREPATSTVSVSDVLARLRGRAATLGLDLREHVSVTSQEPLPPMVASAAMAGGSEALLNVAKHAGVSTVDLFLRWEQGVLEIEITDAGRGWSGAIPMNHGIDTAICSPATAAGMTADVTTTPEAGTTVQLRWVDMSASATGAPSSGSDADWDVDPPRAIAAAAARLASWLIGLFAVLTALAWPAAPSLGSLVSLVILALALAVCWAVARGSWSYPAPWPVAAGLLVAVGVVAVLPAGTSTTCAQVAVGWWGADGALVALVILVVVTAAPAWAVAGAMVLTGAVLAYPLGGAGMPPGCEGLGVRVLALDLGIFAVMLMMRSLLSRLWGETRANRTAVRDRHVAAAVRSALHQARDARIDALLAHAVPLLDGIAAGELEPSDPEVQRRCAAAEQSLRALMQLGPEPTGLADVLADMVVRADEHGQQLVLMSPPAAPVDCPAEVTAALWGILDAVPVGGTMSVAVLSEPGSHVLSIACRPAIPVDQPDASQQVRQDVIMPWTHTADDESYTEIRWPA